MSMRILIDDHGFGVNVDGPGMPQESPGVHAHPGRMMLLNIHEPNSQALYSIRFNLKGLAYLHAMIGDVLEGKDPALRPPPAQILTPNGMPL